MILKLISHRKKDVNLLYEIICIENGHVLFLNTFLVLPPKHPYSPLCQYHIMMFALSLPLSVTQDWIITPLDPLNSLTAFTNCTV